MEFAVKNIGPSRRQLQEEVKRLNQANAILVENLQLRQKVAELEKENEQLKLPLTLTAQEVAEMMRYGITKGYEFVKDLEKLGCPVIKYGREIRVPTQGFLNWLNSGGPKVDKSEKSQQSA